MARPDDAVRIVTSFLHVSLTSIIFVFFYVGAQRQRRIYEH